jgi:hypothetical protein
MRFGGLDMDNGCEWPVFYGHWMQAYSPEGRYQAASKPAIFPSPLMIPLPMFIPLERDKHRTGQIQLLATAADGPACHSAAHVPESFSCEPAVVNIARESFRPD